MDSELGLVLDLDGWLVLGPIFGCCQMLCYLLWIPGAIQHLLILGFVPVKASSRNVLIHVFSIS